MCYKSNLEDEESELCPMIQIPSKGACHWKTCFLWRWHSWSRFWLFFFNRVFWEGGKSGPFNPRQRQPTVIDYIKGPGRAVRATILTKLLTNVGKGICEWMLFYHSLKRKGNSCKRYIYITCIFLTLTRMRVSSFGIDLTQFSTSSSVTSIRQQLLSCFIMG